MCISSLKIKMNDGQCISVKWHIIHFWNLDFFSIFIHTQNTNFYSYSVYHIRLAANHILPVSTLLSIFLHTMIFIWKDIANPLLLLYGCPISILSFSLSLIVVILISWKIDTFELFLPTFGLLFQFYCN